MQIAKSIQQAVKYKVQGNLLVRGENVLKINSITANGIVVDTEEIPGYTTELITWDKIA